MELLPKELTYENVKEEEEAKIKAKQKGYEKVKADPAPKEDPYGSDGPERILIPGMVEGFSSIKLAVNKLTSEKDCNTKQIGAKRVVF